MEPLAGVGFVQGDFRENEVLEALKARLGRGQIDLLLSGMAPNLSGMDAVDAPRTLYLAELALEMGRETLKPGASALIKVLQGAGFEELIRTART